MTTYVWTETLGWVLFHSLWQVTVLALALALLLRFVPRSLAGARYAAAGVTMLGMLALPIATGVQMARGHADSRTTSDTSLRPATEQPAAVRERIATSPTYAPPHVTTTHVSLLTTKSNATAALRPLMPVLAFVWMLGALVLTVRTAGGWALNRALVRTDIFSPPQELRDTIVRLCRAMHIKRPVRLLLSCRVAAPVLIGFWRPVVLLPISALSALPPWQVELLLRHELAHVRRYDYVFNVLQSLVEVLLFHHPAAWWVSRQIRIEREYCCDDEVAAVVGVSSYVRALVAMEELRTLSSRDALPLALGADGGSLLARVQRLTRTQPPVTWHWARWPRQALAPLVIGGPLIVALLGILISGGLRSSPDAPHAVVASFAHSSTMRPPVSSLHAACNTAQVQTLTLCAPLSHYITDLLQRRGVAGAVVVQDVATGAVISYTAARQRDGPRITDMMTPASIWKLSLAALWWEQGMADATVPCPKRLVVGGRAIEHWGSPRARMTASEMLVESCNTAAAAMVLALRDRMGPHSMREAFRRLGFPFVTHSEVDDRQHEAAFWATASPAWREGMSPKSSALRLPLDEDDAGWAAFAVGSGVELSALHVARFVQAIGRDGLMRRPTVERAFAVKSDTGQRIMSQATARRLRAAMREVVRGGTAQGTEPLLRSARWSLSGKTASQAVRADARVDGWFTGLLFDENQVPRYAVVVFVRGKGPGGGVAASIAADLTRAIGGKA